MRFSEICYNYTALFKSVCAQEVLIKIKSSRWNANH